MSFIDYGFEVFPFSLQNHTNVIQPCGDFLPPSASLSGKKNVGPLLENSCYQLIIDHLIYLGTCTENELALVQSELEKYKKLQLTDEQMKLLRRLDDDCKKLEGLCDGDHDDCWRTLNEHCYVSLLLSRENEKKKNWCSCSCENVSPRRQSNNKLFMSEESFRATIIQKDSEIISLKNEKAVKETEVKELEEEKRKLEVIMEKMRNDIELLESSSRISQLSIEEVVRQKNEELDALHRNNERIEEKLNSEHQARISLEQEMKKLQTLVGEIQALRKNLAEEAKTAKRRIQALEESNDSQAAIIKQLQRERESIEKQSIEQENEIEKLLSIMKRLDEKHDRSKAELLASERRVAQCREQLEKVEHEVSRLIAELSDCLGRVDPSIAEPVEEDLYVRASQLTRGLSKFVSEHGRCQADRQDLLRQIDRLRAQPLERVTNSENYRAIKSDLQDTVDDLLSRLDEARRLEKSQRAYVQLAGEASLALQKLEQKIDDHHVYKRCESFLLLELENLQDALDGAERTINGLDCKKTARAELPNDYSDVEAVLSKKILQRVQNSTQIVIRITTALRDDSKLKMTYNKNLENQLQQALLALNEIGIEKCQLQSDLAGGEEKCKDLALQVEKLKTTLAEKSEELSSYRKKFQDSRSENAALIKKSDETIESLQRELQNREAKLRDYGKFNDFLNGKLEESNRMIEQLQSSIVRENMRKLDLESFTALHERILELVAEKDELTDKIAMLQSQLASYERSNNKLQTDLAKLQQDNESLERSIRNFKCENERLASHMVRENDAENSNIRSKCDEMIERMGKISRDSKLVCQSRNEIKAHKDKLCYQEKELMMKEREIVEMKKSIESLNAEITELKKKENSCDLQKRIESLTREKTELKDELKQTLAKYEDKLAEMHKQYKQSEIELHKKHSDSIRRLEAKYTEMIREDGVVFDSQKWLQSLSPRGLQELHDKICKTPLCSASTYEKELYEEQAKGNPSAAQNYGIKKSLQARKDARSLKNSSSNFVKPRSSRTRISARDSSSNHSIIVPEKDHSHHRSTRCK